MMIYIERVIYDKYQVIEEPYESKGSRTVLESSKEGRPSLLRYLSQRIKTPYSNRTKNRSF
uniref:Uncharacterized protein n=1 Tax=Wolbachia endosymbiont of Aleurodicus floccissimus TaxID=2152762 RepID=A0A3B0JLX4_9RICK